MGGDAGTLASPPPAGPVQAPNGSTTVTFAVTKLYIGDTDPGGTPDVLNGWKHFGYNIDGVAPNNLAGFCKPLFNACPGQVHAEGINGIENSFGHNILPLLLGINPQLSATINQDIALGGFSLLFSLDKLGTSSSANPVASVYAAAGSLGTVPLFDGTDVWPVIQGTGVNFPQAYLVNDTWVSGPPTTIGISLPIMGFALALHLNHAVFTMNLDATHQTVKGGILSGVVPTADLENQVAMIAGSFDPTLCSGPTIQAILQQIAAASDILQDGTQDPTKSCDGISVGLGFDAVVDQLGPTIAPVTMPNPCGPADAGPG
jgi:hypothetical protein